MYTTIIKISLEVDYYETRVMAQRLRMLAAFAEDLGSLAPSIPVSRSQPTPVPGDARPLWPLQAHGT